MNRFYNYDKLFRIGFSDSGLILEYAIPTEKRGKVKWSAETIPYDDVKGEIFNDFHAEGIERLRPIIFLSFSVATFFGEPEEDEQVYLLEPALYDELVAHGVALSGLARLNRATTPTTQPEQVFRFMESKLRYLLVLAAILLCTGALAAISWIHVNAALGGCSIAIGLIGFFLYARKRQPFSQIFSFFDNLLIVDEISLFSRDKLVIYYEDVKNYTEFEGKLLIETELQFLAVNSDPALCAVLRTRFADCYDPNGRTLDEQRGRIAFSE